MVKVASYWKSSTLIHILASFSSNIVPPVTKAKKIAKNTEKKLIVRHKLIRNSTVSKPINPKKIKRGLTILLKQILQQLVFSTFLSGLPVCMTKLNTIRLFSVDRIDAAMRNDYYDGLEIRDQDAFSHLLPETQQKTVVSILVLSSIERYWIPFKQNFYVKELRSKYNEVLNTKEQRMWWANYNIYPMYNSSPPELIYNQIQKIESSTEFRIYCDTTNIKSTLEPTPASIDSKYCKPNDDDDTKSIAMSEPSASKMTFLDQEDDVFQQLKILFMFYSNNMD